MFLDTQWYRFLTSIDDGAEWLKRLRGGRCFLTDEERKLRVLQTLANIVTLTYAFRSQEPEVLVINDPRLRVMLTTYGQNAGTYECEDTSKWPGEKCTMCEAAQWLADQTLPGGYKVKGVSKDGTKIHICCTTES